MKLKKKAKIVLIILVVLIIGGLGIVGYKKIFQHER